MFEEIICGETEISIENYTLEIQKLKNNNPITSCTGMEAQYNLLFQLTPDPNDVECNTAKAHTNKNRSNNYLPREGLMINEIIVIYLLLADKFTVALNDTNGGYINASYLNVSHNNMWYSYYYYCSLILGLSEEKRIHYCSKSYGKYCQRLLENDSRL